MKFADRADAGRQLARRLLRLKLRNPVVMALPRGGVPVALEIARALGAPLDLVLVRKIGAPGNPELAVGAIAEGCPAAVFIDRALVRLFGISEDHIAEEKKAALKEIARRRAVYLGQRRAVPVQGHPVIVVDDGIATGATMLAALQALRLRRPASLILAVPVAPPEMLDRLRHEVDQIICLIPATDFHAVGQFYDAFPQLSDGAVVAMMDEASRFTGADSGGRYQ